MYSICYELSYPSLERQHKPQERKVMLHNSSLTFILLMPEVQQRAGYSHSLVPRMVQRPGHGMVQKTQGASHHPGSIAPLM